MFALNLVLFRKPFRFATKITSHYSKEKSLVFFQSRIAKKGLVSLNFRAKNQPGKEGRWVGKEVRDPVIENKILKASNK